MPLHQIIHPNPHTKVLLWKITESFEQLSAEVELKEKSLQRLNGMKSQLHQRAFLSVRKLLQEIGYTDFDLHYDISGKPYFDDGKHISISHSHEFASIIISDNAAGIDLELCRDKAAVIAHKFLHDTETEYLNAEDPDYIAKLTILWGIKEVIFKIRNEPGISFKDHARATPFNLSDRQTTAYLEMGDIHQPYLMHFEQIENFILVYALEDECLQQF